jgi:hypothetical protein
MKRLHIYSSQFIRCPEKPTQRIYLAVPEEIKASYTFYNGYIDIESDAQIESMRYDGMTKFYLFTDEFVKTLINPK